MTNDIVKPSVELVAWTEFQVPKSVEGYVIPDDEGGSELFRQHPYQGGAEDLIEFAGRACYESWDRPNPKTATTTGYIGHILEVAHGSVLEHANATFYIRGVSRSLTHELVRHRHLSPSQLSQRYVPAEDSNIVIPPEMEGEEDMEFLLQEAMSEAVGRYNALVLTMQDKLASEGVTGTEAKKRARQAARCVLPNMTETRLALTGNARAWREVIALRSPPGRPRDSSARRHDLREAEQHLARHLPGHAARGAERRDAGRRVHQRLMALHGQVQENGHVLGSWEAVRLYPRGPIKDLSTRCQYSWSYTPAQQYSGRPQQSGKLWHRYGDGAVKLAVKVLEQVDTAQLGVYVRS
jgi:thymidylate synthase (FAD)